MSVYLRLSEVIQEGSIDFRKRMETALTEKLMSENNKL